MKFLLTLFDWKDALLIVGAALVFRGLYTLHPSAAYIALGAAMVWFALVDRKK